MSCVSEAIKEIIQSLPDGVRLIAVSKTHPADMVAEAYQVGQRDFGENKEQEMTAKAEVLPADIRWHMIGHLQTNKVKHIIPYVYMIHSVDSLRLLQAINKEAQKANRNIRCLLQVHVAQEESKFGFSPQNLSEALSEMRSLQLDNVTICGLMGMATHTDSQQQIRDEFALLHKLFVDIKSQYFASSPDFKELSMGMSDDYRIAISEGSTMVRIGSSIFGQRIYAAKH